MPVSPIRTAAAYIRVSTDEQADQSPESQLIEIRKYAAANNILLPDDLIFMDEGISGKRSENRPAFQRMIGEAKEDPPPFDVILLWKFSRFARNQEESIVYKALLRKQCGVDVISVSEPLPGGPFASLIERIIEWFDEFYSIRLSQEVKRTMKVKAERGELQCIPSFGYKVHMEPGQKSVLEPVPEEAQIVREIFDRFNAGEGFYPIAKWLNAQGIKTHRGNPFENRTVEYMLRNPVYIGKLRWTPTGRSRRDFSNPDTIVADSTHEPIVTQEVFEAAQKRIAEVKAVWGYKTRPTYELKDWLSGLVRCSECGTTLVFVKPRYFKCNNYVRGRCKSSQHIRVDLLHNAVIEKLREDMLSSTSLNYTVSPQSPARAGELARLRASLADTEKRSARLMDGYLSGAIGLDQFTRFKAELDAQTEDLKKTIAEAEKADASPALLAAALSQKLRETYNTLTSPDASLTEKNTALRNVTESIIFNRSTMTLSITYRLIL